MRVTSVNYKKIFPIAPYVNLTLGVEVDINEGESADDAFDLAKETIESWYEMDKIVEETERNRNVPINTPVKLEVNAPKVFTKMDNTPLMEINRNDEKIEIAIDNAQTLEELNALSKNLPTRLWVQFNDKLSKLKNK